jgi:hypothetical protein
MTYKIVSTHGHYEVYIDGKFYCSADTMHEAAKEVEEYENGI